MKNIFYTPENVEQYDAVVKKLRIDLDELVEGAVPEKEAFEYVELLLDQITTKWDDYDALYLGIGDVKTMPFDIIVEYLLTPTYIATAIICYSYLHYESVQKIPNLFDKLNRLMEGCLFSAFKGHGFYWRVGLIDAMTIFYRGNVSRFLKKHADLNERFAGQFELAKEYIIKHLYENGVRDAFGGDYLRAAEDFLMLTERMDGIDG